MNIYHTREGARLATIAKKTGHWNRWGPFLAERAWGTVREDYSAGGNAWGYFTHDHARSRAYRWNEDGLAGICDRHQQLCFALALWNGRDPILKERIYGLAGRCADPDYGDQSRAGDRGARYPSDDLASQPLVVETGREARGHRALGCAAWRRGRVG